MMPRRERDSRRGKKREEKIMRLKKNLATIAAGILSLCTFAPLTGFERASAGEQPLKPLDMYLIAGQSNAAGYTTHKGEKTETFENVGYAGETDKNRTTGMAPQSYLTFGSFRWSVSAGLGSYPAWMGPEYGMAKAFNDLYAEQDQTKAFIFKSAAGNTSVRPLEYQFGNWYPRSGWSSEYKPGPETSKSFQYYSFIENFKTVYGELVANGYSPKVRGLAWMQGESDVGYETSYEKLIKKLIADFREDLSAITGDETLLEMPFVMGKIGIFASYDSRPAVLKFNEVQDKVAAELKNVSTVSTSDLILIDKDGKIHGTDAYHFNANDMETLGMRFGAELAKARVAELEAANKKEEDQENEEKSGGCSGSLGAGFGAATLLVGGVAVLAQKKKRD